MIIYEVLTIIAVVTNAGRGCSVGLYLSPITFTYRWCGNQGGNSWEWEFLGISGNSHPLSAHCPTQSGNGNSWEREFPGIPRNSPPRFSFPAEITTYTFTASDSQLALVDLICEPQQLLSDTAEKLRVAAFQRSGPVRCITVDLSLRCHQVMDLRFGSCRFELESFP